jgi:hypothetical protein
LPCNRLGHPFAAARKIRGGFVIRGIDSAGAARRGEIASVIWARFLIGELIGVPSLTLLRQQLAQMGAIPADWQMLSSPELVIATRQQCRR